MLKRHLQKNDNADGEVVALEESFVRDSLEVVVDDRREAEDEREDACGRNLKGCLMFYVARHKVCRTTQNLTLH
jgi:hypothetical protein